MKWILFFLLVPVVELALLLQVGKWLGLWPTVAMIVFTGVLGATLTRRQGWGAWRAIQQSLAAGRLPTNEILDGLCILLAGAFLLTPGLLTDLVGFLLLLPSARRPLQRYLHQRLERSMRQQILYSGGASPVWASYEVIEGSAEVIEGSTTSFEKKTDPSSRYS